MNNSADYLQMMGISQWRLRTVKSSIFYRYTFYNEEQPIGYLLADATLANEAEQQLVEAIAKAIKKKFAYECVNALNATDFIQARAIILLGEQAIKTLGMAIDKYPVVTSYSPAELLANPNLKAKTWEEVKKAMRMME